jgi:two-component SAPR family response regulator
VADPRQLPEIILTERGAYRLNPGAVWIDAAAIRARLVRQQRVSDDDLALPLLEEALTLYRGTFCAGQAYGWCDEQRRIYEAMAERCARAVAAGYARQHRYREAIELYEDLRRANPLDEELARFEMICQALVNNRPAVRRVFEETHRAVTAAFDGAESVTEETVELYQGLIGGTTRPCVEVILAGSPRPAYA